MSALHVPSIKTPDWERRVATAVNASLTGLDTKIDEAEKGVAGGVAALDGDGRVPAGQLPALAFAEVFVVNSEAAQLALVVESGDVAIRTDLSKSYVHNGGTSGTMADWQELLTPTDAVTSVNGMTGTVTLNKNDVGLGNADNTSDLNKPISTATQAALDLKLDDSQASAFGLTLIDDADASAARSTLGLGTAATQNTGSSGPVIPLLNGTNAWTGVNTYSSASLFRGSFAGLTGAAAALVGYSSAAGFGAMFFGRNPTGAVNTEVRILGTTVYIATAASGDGTVRATISDSAVACSVPLGLPSYTVAGVPTAATAGRLIYVSNESGGAVVAFSDGVSWRRVTDRAIVS